MHLRAIFHLISFTMYFIGASMVISCGVSVMYSDPAHAIIALAVSALLTLAAATALWWFTRGPIELSRRDGFGVVTFGWIMAAVFGALPYLLDHTIESPISALFESMSGFTTTGASVVPHLDDLPRGILFWRSLTQWLGGMGVLVLCIAILPFIGVGGMQLYRAEMPGPTKDRLAPRIATTAKALWLIYLSLSVLQALALRLAGMTWFDAVCHTFATVSTGGFSTHDKSIAAFDSAAIEAIIVFFMILAGTSFSLHFKAVRRGLMVYLRDPEYRCYLGILLGAIVAVFAVLLRHGDTPWGSSLRQAIFQVTSILTTTGFATADYGAWAMPAPFIVVSLMFIGACAGSTSGSIKVVRVVIVLKKIMRELQLFMTPNAIIQVRLGRQLIPNAIVPQTSAFALAFFLLFGVSSLLMSMFTPDFSTAWSSVIATLGNIGPGLGPVGPTGNFSSIPSGGQLLLSFLMLLGRLELYTVLVLFTADFWRS